MSDNFAYGAGFVELTGIQFHVHVDGTPLTASGGFRFSFSGVSHTVDADCIVVVANQAWVAGPPNEPGVPPGSRFELVLQDDSATGQQDKMNEVSFLGTCGIVTATAEGRRVRYELADDRLVAALRILASLDLPGRCD